MLQFEKEHIKLQRFFSYTSGVYTNLSLVELEWQDIHKLPQSRINRKPLVQLREKCVELALSFHICGEYGELPENFYKDNKTVFEFEYLGNTYYISYYDGSYRLAIDAWMEFGTIVNFKTKEVNKHYSDFITSVKNL